MALPILGILGMIFKPIAGAFTNWQDRKKAKLESDLLIQTAMTHAKIERLSTGQKADIAWENLSVTNSGWKDEWFTIVLSIPAILVFMPGMVDTVLQGFRALQECPDWYQWMLGIAVGSAFGYRRIADFMKLRKGD